MDAINGFTKHKIKMHKQITKNLTLNYIEDNVIKDGKITVVMCSLSFYGDYGAAYISVKEKPYRVIMFETIDSDIHDDFSENVEIYLKEISKHIDDFLKEN